MRSNVIFTKLVQAIFPLGLQMLYMRTTVSQLQYRDLYKQYIVTVGYVAMEVINFTYYHMAGNIGRNYIWRKYAVCCIVCMYVIVIMHLHISLYACAGQLIICGSIVRLM